MINVPTLDDVEELREKLNALDDVMAEVYQRVQELHAVADSRAADVTTEKAEPPAAKKQRRKKKSAD